VVNTQDEELMEMLADQVWVLESGFRFSKLSKEEEYAVTVGFESESP